MAPNLLIIGGTTEAKHLAKRVAELGIKATYSYAGRVTKPDAQPLPTRIGGFGGTTGLAAFLTETGTTHIIDATHPFAAQISWNAAAASQQTGIPLVALTRPPWVAETGDRWQVVPDIASAVAALHGPAQNVFLAIGRLEIEAFTAAPQHRYLLRFIDNPETPPDLPAHQVVLGRGPFDEPADRAVLETHRIDLIVSKNSGGSGVRAKIDAARHLGLPVLMIDRPVMPRRNEVHHIDDVMSWLGHADTERGV